MHHQKNDPQKDKRVIINWLAHHNPNLEDFDDHVFYIFNHAVCIGCFAFLVGATFALIISNLFYYYIANFISLSIILMIFFICWIPSIFQYLIQIIRKKPLTNRIIKFICRFLYPIGSIIFIFKSPILGLIIAIPAGYVIIFIRIIKNKTLIAKRSIVTKN